MANKKETIHHFASGAKMVLTEDSYTFYDEKGVCRSVTENNLIKVFDQNGICRVKMGVWK